MVGQYEPPAEEAPAEQTMVIHDVRLEQKFTQVPYEVVFMRGLSRDAKHTYTVLLSYAWKHNRCFPGMMRLCEDLGASEPVARRFLRELQAYRLIRVERRGLQRTNLYHFLPVADAGEPPILTVVPPRPMSPERKTRFTQERKTRFTPERNAGHAQERKTRFTPTKEEEYTEGNIPRESNTTASAVGADAPRRTTQKQPGAKKPKAEPRTTEDREDTKGLAEAWMKANEIDPAAALGVTIRDYRSWAAAALKHRDRETLTRCLRWIYTKRRYDGAQFTITPRVLDERIGQWCAAGKPERYEPPSRVMGNGTMPAPLPDPDAPPRWMKEDPRIIDRDLDRNNGRFIAYWGNPPFLMSDDERAAAGVTAW